MNGELLSDELATETEWFIANAAMSDRIPAPSRLVSRLLQIARAQGFPFRATVLALSQWCDDHPKQTSKYRRPGSFYVQSFLHQRPRTPEQPKRQDPLPPAFTSWLRGVDA